jgi:hypothetical protein
MDTNEHEIRLLQKGPNRCSGVSVERRQLEEMNECGFLPKAATLVWQRSSTIDSCLFVFIRG